MAVAVAVVGTDQMGVVYSMDRGIATGGEVRRWWAPPRSGTKETGEAGTAGGGGLSGSLVYGLPLSHDTNLE